MRTMWGTSEDRRLTGVRSPSPTACHSTRRVVAAVGVAVCLLGAVSCNELVQASRSSTILVIERIAALAGGSFLNSDVATASGGVLPDIGRISTRLAFKSPGTSENPASPTSANWITITGYRVVYQRSDGRNEEGRDVPYRFEGGLTMTTTDTGTAEFTLVRAQAKLEQPLISLRQPAGFVLGGAGAISVIAKITFFGHDQTGAAISADGTIGITFADFPG